MAEREWMVPEHGIGSIFGLEEIEDQIDCMAASVAEAVERVGCSGPTAGH